VHIPFVLPGERVTRKVTGIGGSIQIENPSSERVQPICKHFGTCGGCSLQHWQQASYLKWKEVSSGRIEARWIETVVEPIKRYPVASRRRATFTVTQISGRLEFGLYIAQSHDVVDLSECPILLLPFRRFCRAKNALALASEQARRRCMLPLPRTVSTCVINAPPLQPAQKKNSFLRSMPPGLSARCGTVIPSFFGSPPAISFAVSRLHSPGAFCKAVEACERDWLASLAGDGEGCGRPVLRSLFADLVPSHFRAARFAAVAAYEENAAAIAALGAAAKTRTASSLSKRCGAISSAAAWSNGTDKFAAVIATPTEALKHNCRAIASSKQETVVMISCNPTTFARDAALFDR